MSASPNPGRTDRNPVYIAISRRTLLVIAGGVAVIWLALHLVNVLVVLFSAILVATAVDPVVQFFERRRLPRALGVLLVFLLFALLLAGVVALLVPLIGSELVILRQELPRYADDLEQLLARVAPNEAKDTSITFDRLVQILSGHIDTVVLELTRVTLTFAHAALLLFITFVLGYFMAVNPRLGRIALERLVPEERRPTAFQIAAAVRVRIGGWVRGQLAVSATFGLAMGLGLWALGVPYAASLGTTAAVLELVPYLGGAVTLLLAVPLALTVGVPQAIGVVVLYAVLTLLESHVLNPIFVGRAVGMPPVVVLTALVAGIELAGILGALLAIPVTVIVWAIVAELGPARFRGKLSGDEPTTQTESGSSP